MKLMLSLFLLISFAASGQSTGPATTKGPCSPAITGSGNTINIKTCGLEQGDEFRKLLKTIVSNQQVDTATILKKLDECLQTMAERHLTDAQKAFILAKLSPLFGHKMTIAIPLGNSEAKGYAMDFVELFRKARWLGVEGAGMTQAIYDKDPIGIEVSVNATDAQARKIPPDAVTLLDTLVELGLTNKTLFTNSGIPPGETEIRIGPRQATH